MMYGEGDVRKNSCVIMAFKGRPATKRKSRNLNCFVSLEPEPLLEPELGRAGPGLTDTPRLEAVIYVFQLIGEFNKVSEAASLNSSSAVMDRSSRPSSFILLLYSSSSSSSFCLIHSTAPSCILLLLLLFILLLLLLFIIFPLIYPPPFILI